MVFDLVVIGGGAAGYFGAISAAESASRPLKILILEKGAKSLTKVRISGGGRCNVTNTCESPRPLIDSYPRGHRSLIGPFSRFGTAETVEWFQNHGVPLVPEPDGRMFPSSNTSEAVISCFEQHQRKLGIEVRHRCQVERLTSKANVWQLETSQGPLAAHHVLIATGGTRLKPSASLPTSLGHKMSLPKPSLFAVDIPSKDLKTLAGISVPEAEVRLQGHKKGQRGPLLITHRGLSGPAVLRLSAWHAPHFHETNYQTQITVNWAPNITPLTVLEQTRQHAPRQLVAKKSPVPDLPHRLWAYFCQLAGVPPETTWSHLGKKQTLRLESLIKSQTLEVHGQSTNKDEFVTCGGVPLREINLQTMESKIAPGIYFAGEVMDIDGITGGFNFQSAWTTGYLAGQAIAEATELVA